MALQKALLDLPFATGLQQKSDSRLLSVGAATSLGNGVVDKAGAISKRPGSSPVANSAVSPWGNQVFTVPGRQRLYRNQGGGAGLLSSGRAWAFSPTHNAWTDVDYVSTLTATVTGIASPVVACTSYDVAYGSGFVAIVYSVTVPAGSDAYLVILDAASNAVVYGPSQVRTAGAIVAKQARVVIQGGYAIVVYQDDAVQTNIYGRAFDLSGAGFSWGAETLLVSDHDATAARFDVHAMLGSTTTWVLAYAKNPAPGAQVKVALFTAPLTAGATAVLTPAAGFGAGTTIFGVTVHATTAEQIWVGYSTLDNALINNSQRAQGLNPTTLAVTTADFELWSQVGNSVVRLGIERLTATTFVMCGALLGNNDMRHRGGSTGGVTGAGTHITYGWHPASKPFTVDGRVCVNAVQWELVTGARPSYVVVDLNPTDLVTNHYVRPLVTISPRIVSTGIPSMQMLPSAALVSTTRTLTVGSSIRSGADNIGVDLLTIDAPYNTHQIASLGGVNYVSGGIPSALTGQRVSEIGFLEQPAQLVGTPTAGGAMVAGAYNYLVVYEWVDEVTGQRVQSAPAYSAAVTVGGANFSVTLAGTNLHLTTKGDQEKTSTIGIAIYRTSLAATAVFYRLFSGAFPASAQNTQAAAQFSYLDTVPDSAIITNEQYNTAQLVPACPPCLTSLIAHGNRLVGASGTDVWFSKTSDGGTSQPQFSDSLVVQCLDGGNITALASMDGQLVIFKRDAIYVIAGDGPDNNGGGSGWSDPRRVASDVGCTSDWRSVLAMPQGVIFQSEKKLHILTRSLEVQYFSQPVEDELAAMPVVQCIALHSRRDEVRVCLRAAEGGSGATTGATLNWNYVTNVWSKFDYYDTGNNHQNAMWESAYAIDGVFWYASTAITQTENVNLTATGAYLDGGSWVTLSLETAWAKASGVQGWGRFWYARVSGYRGSPHDLTMSIGTDYELSYTQANTFTALAQASWSTYLEEAETHIARQKASAIRVRLSDATPTGVASTTGAGPTLLGIQLEVGLYSGGKRLPPAQGA